MPKLGDPGSAFSVAERCPCAQLPGLWNRRGLVYFLCDFCNRAGPGVKEGPGAAMKAARTWNLMVRANGQDAA